MCSPSGGARCGRAAGWFWFGDVLRRAGVSACSTFAMTPPGFATACLALVSTRLVVCAFTHSLALGVLHMLFTLRRFGVILFVWLDYLMQLQLEWAMAPASILGPRLRLQCRTFHTHPGHVLPHSSVIRHPIMFRLSEGWKEPSPAIPPLLRFNILPTPLSLLSFKFSQRFDSNT